MKMYCSFPYLAIIKTVCVTEKVTGLSFYQDQLGQDKRKEKKKKKPSKQQLEREAGRAWQQLPPSTSADKTSLFELKKRN